MKFLIMLAVALGISSCAGTIVPETGTERYVVADAAFKAVLGTVREMVLSGRIPAEAAPRLKIAIAAAKSALDAWALVPGDRNAEMTALLALQAARSLLLTIEAGHVEYHSIDYAYGAVA